MLSVKPRTWLSVKPRTWLSDQNVKLGFQQEF